MVEEMRRARRGARDVDVHDATGWQRVWVALVRHRFIVAAIGDCLLWAAALVVAVWARYEFDVPDDAWRGVFVAVPIAAFTQLAVGVAIGTYMGRWQHGSFEEVAGLAKVVVAVTGVLMALDLAVNVMPLSTVFISPALALLAMCVARFAWRLAIERRTREAREAAVVEPLLIYGAGSGGRRIIAALADTATSAYRPVGIIDDDPRKANLRFRGVPVLGSGRSLAAVAERTGATTLLLAIPSAGAVVVRDVSEAARAAGLTVKVLPPVADLLDGKVAVDDIRSLTPADLLGRREIDTDIDGIAGYITDKRVLVTGAGGSIGSELCRQLRRFGPATLVMLDRDESALHAVQLSMDGRALLDSDDLVVGDIRDRDAMEQLFERARPEVVFHAAALKHLTLLERFPDEALKTNVWGTQHLLELAGQHGVERFVNISTDKAADPTSVLGWSKRTAERLTAHAARHCEAVMLSVRFGNVLGSRGSVLTAFHHQIANGGPVTVTDPEVTRFFMTIEEAVQLVIQAGAIGSHGDALVLDMGVPVRIADVARQLVEQAERKVEIVYTGLRPGEKLHEVLRGADEVGVSGPHPMITHVPVEPMEPGDVVDDWRRGGEARPRQAARPGAAGSGS